MQLFRRAAKLAAILAQPTWREALLRYGVAAGTEHAAVLRHLRSARTVVDIGANRGQFALAVRVFCPQAWISSFEPLSGPANVYRSVLSAESKQTVLYESAIGPKKSEVEIHLSQREDCSSLLSIGPAQDRLFPGTGEIGTQIVSVAKLSDHVRAETIQVPALLKIDVQGYELQALQGCEDLLPLFEWTYVECSFVELYTGQALAEAVIGWLRDRRFILYGVYNLVYDQLGIAVQGDFLFARAE